jgi:hypothetical protein
MVMKQIKNAEKMIQVIEKKKMKMEYRTSTLKGVSNLSRSDLDSVVFYAEAFIRSGGTGFPGLMEPRGTTEELLKKYEVI